MVRTSAECKRCCLSVQKLNVLEYFNLLLVFLTQLLTSEQLVLLKKWGHLKWRSENICSTVPLSVHCRSCKAIEPFFDCLVSRFRIWCTPSATQTCIGIEQVKQTQPDNYCKIRVRYFKNFFFYGKKWLLSLVERGTR